MQRASDESPRLVAVRSSLSAYASAVFDAKDIVEVRLVPSGHSSWCRAHELSRFAEPLIRANGNGENIYVGANPRSRHGGTETADVAIARCLFADFDHASVDQTLAQFRLMQMPLPTLLVSSGHGCHAYWRLLSPLPQLDLWRGWQLDLIAMFGADHKIHDPPRVMRLPGFLNTKHAPHVPCEIVECDAARMHDLADLPIPMRSGSDTPRPPYVWTFRRSGDGNNGADRVARCRAYLLTCPNAISGQRGHDTTWHAANTCNRFGLTQDEARDTMRWYSAEKCDPPWSEREILHKVGDAYSRNGHEHGQKLTAKRAHEQRGILHVRRGVA